MTRDFIFGVVVGAIALAAVQVGFAALSYWLRRRSEPTIERQDWWNVR